MKICFVDQHYEHLGGAEKYHLSVMECALALGHDVSVVHGKKPRKPRPLRAIRAHHVAHIEELAPFQREEAARVSARLGEALRAERPDIVYLHNIRNPDTVEECLAHAPAFRYVHDPSLACFRHWKLLPDGKTPCVDPLGQACVRNGCFVGYPYPAPESLEAKRREIEAHRRLAGILVASTYVRDLLVQNGLDPRRIHVRPYPLTVRPIPAAELRTAGERPVRRILFVGHLHPIKGLEHLLRALAGVGGRWRLVVVGAGSHEKEYRRLARRLGIGWKVRFAGWIDPARMPRVYRKADLLVVPSHWPEPYGMVGAEAMAHGVPVVAFDTGGIGEWCIPGETGILVPRADTDGLAEVLRRAVEAKIDFAPLIRHGYEFATSRGVEDHTRDLVALFAAAKASR